MRTAAEVMLNASSHYSPQVLQEGHIATETWNNLHLQILSSPTDTTVEGQNDVNSY